MTQNTRNVLFLLVIIGWLAYVINASIVTPEPVSPIKIDWSEAYEATPQEFERRHVRPKVQRLPPVEQEPLVVSQLVRAY